MTHENGRVPVHLRFPCSEHGTHIVPAAELTLAMVIALGQPGGVAWVAEIPCPGHRPGEGAGLAFPHLLQADLRRENVADLLVGGASVDEDSHPMAALFARTTRRLLADGEMPAAPLAPLEAVTARRPIPPRQPGGHAPAPGRPDELSDAARHLTSKLTLDDLIDFHDELELTVDVCGHADSRSRISGAQARMADRAAALRQIGRLP